MVPVLASDDAQYIVGVEKMRSDFILTDSIWTALNMDAKGSIVRIRSDKVAVYAKRAKRGGEVKD